jgi:hypothetical protein
MASTLIENIEMGELLAQVQRDTTGAEPPTHPNDCLLKKFETTPLLTNPKRVGYAQFQNAEDMGGTMSLQ